MPKPKGWTSSMLKKRDSLEKKLEKKYGKNSAYAIATSQVKKGKKRK